MGQRGESSSVKMLRGPNPRRNLPSARKRGESNLLRAFERAYLGRRSHGVAHSDFDLHGYGIADLVWMSFDAPNGTGGSAVRLDGPPVVRIIAFEIKLRDWRKALNQAFRYSYFADQAVVVVPPTVAANALPFSKTFQRLNVALWSFDKTTGRIRQLIAQTEKPARSRLARDKAVAVLMGSTKFCELHEAL
jgi:hypothetical protein